MTRNVGTFLRHLSLIFTNDKPVEMVLASDYDALAAENARLRAQIAEMQGERDVAELSRDAAHARLAECESQLRAVALKP